MALGVWLHLSEQHEHEHEHQSVEHAVLGEAFPSRAGGRHSYMRALPLGLLGEDGKFVSTARDALQAYGIPGRWRYIYYLFTAEWLAAAKWPARREAA